MGIYCYAVRAKSHRIQLADGTSAQAHEHRFLFNGGTYYTPTNLQRGMATRIEKTWEGKPLPAYVVACGEEGPQPHDPVYRFTGRNPLWVDCDKFPGEQIGYISRIERGTLYVGPCQHEACKGHIPPFDLETGQDICMYCREQFGPEDRARAQAYIEKSNREEAERKAEAEARGLAYGERKAEADAFLTGFRAPQMFKLEVEVYGSGWVENALRFPTEEAAQAYSRTLFGHPSGKVLLNARVVKA